MNVNSATPFVDHGTTPSTASAHTWGHSEIERLQARSSSPAWVIYIALGVLAISYVIATSFEDWCCAALIEIAAFCPLFLWARRSVLGMPIMPVYAFMHLAYYGMPFAGGHSATSEYEFSEKLIAAATVAGVVLLMTLIWAKLAKPAPPRVRVVRMLTPDRRTVWILLGFLAGAVAFHSNVLLYVIDAQSAVFGIVRAVLGTLGVLSLFCLSYFFGSGFLKGTPRYLFLGLTLLLLAFQMASLYLIVVAQFGIAAVVGYSLGAGRVPWKLIAAVVVSLTVLQAGKMDLRQKYSATDGPGPSTFELLGEWITTGVDKAIHPENIESDQTVALAERISLIQMLLRTQALAPDEVDYLYGTSYTGIPFLMVPRIIWPERPTTGELLIQLNEHYGLLDRNSAETVSIGWGVLPEAFANFGFLGCILLAALMGSIVGMTQRLCGRYSMLSARGMVAVVVLFALIGMEASLAQLLTTLSQSLLPVAMLAFLGMQPRRILL